MGVLILRTFGCREQRTTALHDRFFAYSETAIVPLPVLKNAHGRLERVLRIKTPNSPWWHHAFFSDSRNWRNFVCYSKHKNNDRVVAVNFISQCLITVFLLLLATNGLAQSDSGVYYVKAGDNAGLIQAIEDANAMDGEFSTIVIQAGDHGETGFIFTLPYGETDTALPPISEDITFDMQLGNSRQVAFQRASSVAPFRLFDVVEKGKLRLQDAIVDGFNVTGNGGAIRAGADARVDIYGSLFRNNFASGFGGAIEVAGNAQLVVRGKGGALGDGNSLNGPTEFTGNRSAIVGGAISITGNAHANIFYAVLADNDAGFEGCDLYISSTGDLHPEGEALILQNSTFDGNCSGTLVENSRGLLSVKNTTFAGRGTGIFGGDWVDLFSNIFDLAAKDGCLDVGGAFNSRGYSLESGNTCSLDQPTDFFNTDPMLKAEDNHTFSLLPGSPAIDAGASEISDAINQKNGLPCGYVDTQGLGRPQDADLDGTYECDIGSYEVQGGPDIGPAQSAAWYDPGRNGEGDFLEMLSGESALAAKFTYAMDGSGPAWFIGVGSVVGNSVVISDMVYPTGGVFGAGFDPDAIVREPVGGMSMVFSNCESGASKPGRMMFESDPNSPFGDLLADAFRLSDIVDCNGSQSPQSGRSGSFYDPERDGEGVFVQWLTGGGVLIIWYTFDPDGNQLWVISESAVVDGNKVTANMLYPAASTSYGENFDASEIDLQPWGILTLEYQPGCDGLLFSYESSLDGYGTGAYDYVRLTRLAGTSCDL